MLAVWKRELQAYFRTPVAYIFMGVFLLVSGLFFTMNLLAGSGAFAQLLSSLSFLFILVVPVLTMRLLSEERKNKTDQLLLTSPLSITAIVLGKFLAAMTVFALTLVCTFVYPIIITSFGCDIAIEAVSSYIGFFLLGTATIAIGMFISSLAENQATAAAATFGVLLLMWMINMLSSSVPAWLGTILDWFSLYDRYTGFGLNIMGISPIFYFLSVTALFLFLTVRSIDKRRWSEA